MTHTLDQALRERIAREIELVAKAELMDKPSAFIAGLMFAARIARWEGDAHRPERCPTCGCDLAYPTAVHIVDCGEGE